MTAAVALVERLAGAAGLAGWAFVGACVAWALGDLLGEVTACRS